MAKHSRKHPLRRLAVLAVLILVLVLFFRWENTSLQIARFDPVFTDLPDGFNGCRIVVLSDLHGAEFGENNEELFQTVADQSPEYIFYLGDLEDKYRGPDPGYAEAVAAGLTAIAPTYYVTGNHEWAAGVAPQLEELLTDYGVTVLSNEYVMLEQGGDRIALVGAEDPNGYADQPTVAQLLDQVRAEQGAVYTILLSHRNNHYAQYAEARADLTLSGHAHGGLIRLPGTDGLIGPKRELWPAYTAGLYDLDYGQMVVSRGLGNQFPCFRLFNRPDVPLVVLE